MSEEAVAVRRDNLFIQAGGTVRTVVATVLTVRGGERVVALRTVDETGRSLWRTAAEELSEKNVLKVTQRH